jgi:DNA-binding GntR family transcriptional regulator
MLYIRIDKSVKTPYYKQIVNSLKDAILNGYLKENDRLPTDLEVSKFFNLSLIVGKQAYDNLEKEGFVKRIKGKGTFVSARPKRLVPFSTFYSPSHYLLNETDQIYRFLNFVEYSDDDETLIRIHAQLNGYPFYYQSIEIFKYLNSSVIYLSKDDESNKDILERLIGEKINRIETTLVPKQANSLDALILELQLDEPIHHLESYGYNKQNQLVAVVNTYMPAEYIEFEVTE